MVLTSGEGASKQEKISKIRRSPLQMKITHPTRKKRQLRHKIGIFLNTFSVPGSFEQPGMTSSFNLLKVCLWNPMLKDCPKYISQNSIELQLQAFPYMLHVWNIYLHFIIHVWLNAGKYSVRPMVRNHRVSRKNLPPEGSIPALNPASFRRRPEAFMTKVQTRELLDSLQSLGYTSGGGKVKKVEKPSRSQELFHGTHLRPEKSQPVIFV